jgi:hypothetical protein
VIIFTRFAIGFPCLHTFCETCIHTYITSSVKGDKSTGFKCPICRRLMLFGEKEGNPETWSKQLPGNHFVLSLLNSFISFSGIIECCNVTFNDLWQFSHVLQYASSHTIHHETALSDIPFRSHELQSFSDLMIAFLFNNERTKWFPGNYQIKQFHGVLYVRKRTAKRVKIVISRWKWHYSIRWFH